MITVHTVNRNVSPLLFSVLMLLLSAAEWGGGQSKYRHCWTVCVCVYICSSWKAWHVFVRSAHHVLLVLSSPPCRQSTSSASLRRSSTGKLRSPDCCWKASAAHMWVFRRPWRGRVSPSASLSSVTTSRPPCWILSRGNEQREFLCSLLPKCCRITEVMIII